MAQFSAQIVHRIAQQEQQLELNLLTFVVSMTKWHKNSPVGCLGGLRSQMSKECPKLAFLHKMSIAKMSNNWNMDDTYNIN